MCRGVYYCVNKILTWNYQYTKNYWPCDMYSHAYVLCFHSQQLFVFGKMSIVLQKVQQSSEGIDHRSQNFQEISKLSSMLFDKTHILHVLSLAISSSWILTFLLCHSSCSRFLIERERWEALMMAWFGRRRDVGETRRSCCRWSCASGATAASSEVGDGAGMSYTKSVRCLSRATRSQREARACMARTEERGSSKWGSRTSLEQRQQDGETIGSP